LSFQSSAAPVNMLKLSIEDNDPKDVSRMSIIGSPFTYIGDIAVGAGKIGNEKQEFQHDWGLTLGESFGRGIGGYLFNHSDYVVKAKLYTDTKFETLLTNSMYLNPQLYFGGELTRVNHTYGLRISGENKNNNRQGGHYSFSVVPIPGAVWLFGSGMAGLLGLSRRKEKTGALSV